MDTGTGVNHSSEATCKIRHGYGQSADVPGSAQISDSPHDGMGHQYGTVQANDSTLVIQGNYATINCTHPHGGPEEGGRRRLYKSKTSGDAHPSHKASNSTPLRAYSIDCPRTLPIPKPFPARATPSFTGLYDMEDLASSSVSGKAGFESEATGVQVEITDAGKGVVLCMWPGPDGGTVSIEIQYAVCKSYQIRRLKITTTKSSVLWLPETRMRVKIDGKLVTAQFSNCNKLQSPGPFATENGRRKSVTTYDPEAPNVCLEINAADQALQKVGNYTFMRQSHYYSDGQHHDTILLWKKETDATGETLYEEHDRVSFSDILDLDMSLADRHVRLSFGYMNRLQYLPAPNPPELPQNVKRTPDGGPDSVKFEGAKFPTSRLELVTASTDLEQFEAMFLQPKIKITPSSKGLARVLPGSKEYLTQVTLWSNDNRLRILMRAVDPDDRNDLRPDRPKWYAIALRKNEVPPKASLKQHGEIVLTTEQINYEDGKCLSTKDLRPHTKYPASTGTGRTKSRSVSLEFRFADIPEWARFRKVVSNVYLDVASSNKEDASLLAQNPPSLPLNTSDSALRRTLLSLSSACRKGLSNFRRLATADLSA
ncbi:hypothetical protein LTR70_010466 [Exophiala xenobiotica]|uniref:Uncharacterized protein n=1 Tax=Lithohypha guttulata TaxID=1690604 RepID=A0ABR0JVJ8_9EURO|nr:hypothetical protein LTR24_010412 [Lithohypha guttulata]KAK5309245.1 hypothetical protein LTR70_010466 [Exophiala xenobiotica]